MNFIVVYLLYYFTCVVPRRNSKINNLIWEMADVLIHIICLMKL